MGLAAAGGTHGPASDPTGHSDSQGLGLSISAVAAAAVPTRGPVRGHQQLARAGMPGAECQLAVRTSLRPDGSSRQWAAPGGLGSPAGLVEDLGPEPCRCSRVTATPTGHLKGWAVSRVPAQPCGFGWQDPPCAPRAPVAEFVTPCPGEGVWALPCVSVAEGGLAHPEVGPSP